MFITNKAKIMTPKYLDKLIKKHLQGKCTEEESDFIDSWYSSLGKNIDQREKDTLSEDKISSAGVSILKNLQKHTHAISEDNHINITPNLWQFSAIAASLVLCMAIGYYLFKNTLISDPRIEKNVASQFTSVENSTLQAKRVILPDGSIVELGPNSKIRFLNDADSPSRELFLEGEGYFDVARDSQRPFYVYVGNIVTKVLGTSFIIKTFDQSDKVTVSVKTGKVTVYSKNASHKKTVLTPNQEAVYDRVTDVVATQAVPSQKSTDAKKRLSEMQFEETPISEVLMVLKKTYDIEIVFNEETLSGCVLTSTFFEEGFYDRIDVICTAIGATYKIVNAQIVIESNGCKIKP